MNRGKPLRKANPTPGIARTIRFPAALRERIAADSERCARSFEAQVIAILRRHYGEDVDIAPAPDAILALARGSLVGISDEDQAKYFTRVAKE